jgi:hypothetical protein
MFHAAYEFALDDDQMICLPAPVRLSITLLQRVHVGVLPFDHGRF